MITLGGMNRTQHTFSLCVFCVTTLVGLASAWAGDWMTYRSTYTHDAYGQRVDQHTRPVEPLSPDQGNLVRSGFRHYRSTIQGSTTADNLHITHEWGRPVMPYEHWRFPYRPFGVPYDQWGPPVPNVLSNFNFQGNNWPVGPGLGQVPMGQPRPGLPGAELPGAGMPGAGMPGAGMPGAGMPGAGPVLECLVLECLVLGCLDPTTIRMRSAMAFIRCCHRCSHPDSAWACRYRSRRRGSMVCIPRHRCARSGFTEGLAEAVGYRRSINPSISPTTNPPRCPQLLMRISPNTPAKPSTMNISKKTTRPSGMRKPRSGRCDEISHK